MTKSSDLFDARRAELTEKEAPLAARMRPRTLDEFIGQEHIIGPGRLLRRAIQADQLSSVIFYGPPGTGKTTLARSLMADRMPPPLYLDLEQPEDRARLTDPALFLRGYADRLVVLDEAQRVPDLFEVLRGLNDERRRAGSRSGH